VVGAGLGLGYVLSHSTVAWIIDLRYQPFAIAFAVVVLRAVRARERPVHELAGPLLWCGTVSYGLYLWHPIMLRAIQHTGWVTPGGSWPLSVYVLAGLSLPVAWLSWVLVEKPALALARTHWRPRAVGLSVTTARVLTSDGEAA
jgi:peptidoglycan/LPS O-acetylase OafA/YrhL